MAGLKWFPFSGGELTTDVSYEADFVENDSDSCKGDVERKDMLTFMLGATTNAGNKWYLNSEFSIAAEKAFTCSAGLKFQSKS